MVYEVCALVAVIILGVLGLELAIAVHSAWKLANEARKTLEELNVHLPNMLEDVQAVTSIVRKTSEQVGGTVNEVAVSLEEIRKNPLSLIKSALETVRQLIDLWHEIRRKSKEAGDC